MHVVSKTVSKTHWSHSTGKNSTQPKKTGDVLHVFYSRKLWRSLTFPPILQ